MVFLESSWHPLAAEQDLRIAAGGEKQLRNRNVLHNRIRQAETGFFRPHISLQETPKARWTPSQSFDLPADLSCGDLMQAFCL